MQGILSAGAFSIQRLEGSRYRMVRLWVLNGAEGGEGWGKVESISRAAARGADRKTVCGLGGGGLVARAHVLHCCSGPR
jgi:hypothetical protein